jgi:plasmid maintenance system killer protein
VTGNWRIIFRFEDGDALDVDHGTTIRRDQPWP